MTIEILDDLPATVLDEAQYLHVPKLLAPPDYDGQTTWHLRQGPPGMTVDETTGTIRWKARYQREPVECEVVAVCPESDTFVSQCSLEFEIEVRPIPPKIKPIADINIVSGHGRLVVAPELDGDCTGPITWEVFARSSSMTYQPSSGQITWPSCHYRRYSSDPADRRIVECTVVATGPDPAQAARQKFRIVVRARRAKLEQPPDGQVWELEKYEHQLTLAERGDGALQYELTKAPPGASVSRTGLVTWAAAYSAGPVDFKAKVSGPGGSHRVAWQLTVQSEAPKMRAFTSRSFKEGKVYRRKIDFQQGVGVIELELKGAPQSMSFQPVGSPAQTCEIVWTTRCSGRNPRKVNLEVVATHPKGTDRIAWTLTIERKDETPAEVQPCPVLAQEEEEDEPCCEPTLVLNCMHWRGKSPSQDLRAGTHGWSSFHVTPFPGVNPRDYVLRLPLAGPAKANEKAASELTRDDKKLYQCGGKQSHPVLQVQAGYRQNPDVVDVVVRHADGCAASHVLMPVVETHSPLVRKMSRELKRVRGQGSDPDDPQRYSFPAAADGQVLDTHAVGVLATLAGDLYVLANLNPWRWRHLIVNRWTVGVKDVDLDTFVSVNGRRLTATVEAYPDIRWEVNCTFGRSTQSKEGGRVNDISAWPPQVDIHRNEQGDVDPIATGADDGWCLTGIAKCTYDQYAFDVAVPLASNLEKSIPFLSTLDSAGGFLGTVGSSLPLGISIGLRMPSLTVYVAAEPYEQDNTGLLGYQWKVGFYAAPLIGIEIEWNLLLFIMSVVPYTAPVVPLLQALKTGVGVQGVAKLKVDVGIYLIAGGQIGLELEWAWQRPDGHCQYGQLDGRVDFRIEGRAEADCEVLVLSAGAGVRVGAKTAIGLVGKATHGSGERSVAFQGQTRWEGIVLYFVAYYRCGLKLGPVTRGSKKTKMYTHVLCKPHYWPKAPKPHRIGKTGSGGSAPRPGDDPAKLKEGGDVASMDAHDFDIFEGKGRRGEDVDVDEAELERLSETRTREMQAAEQQQTQELKQLHKKKRMQRMQPKSTDL